MPRTRPRPTHPISLQTVRDTICPPFSVAIPFASRWAPDTLTHRPLWRQCATGHAGRQVQTCNAFNQSRLVNTSGVEGYERTGQANIKHVTICDRLRTATLDVTGTDDCCVSSD